MRSPLPARIVSAFFVLPLACFVVSPAAQAQQADLVLRKGRIVTVSEDFEIVPALAVKDGHVIATGTDDRIASHVGPETQVIDLDGKMVLPGLIDSHVQPTGASRFEADHT